MSLPATKHKMKSGQFCKENGEYYFKEFDDTFGYKFTLYPLNEIEGISRKAEFKVCFAKQIDDDSKISGKQKIWFIQNVKLTVRPEIANIYLIFNSHNKKWYLRDFEELGQTVECGLVSNQNVICEKSEPERCTLKDVKEIMKTSGYVYSSVTLKGNEIDSYVVEV
jgi:uncharacterized protein YwqG